MHHAAQVRPNAFEFASGKNCRSRVKAFVWARGRASLASIATLELDSSNLLLPGVTTRSRKDTRLIAVAANTVGTHSIGPGPYASLGAVTTVRTQASRAPVGAIPRVMTNIDARTERQHPLATHFTTPEEADTRVPSRTNSSSRQKLC